MGQKNVFETFETVTWDSCILLQTLEMFHWKLVFPYWFGLVWTTTLLAGLSYFLLTLLCSE